MSTVVELPTRPVQQVPSPRHPVYSRVAEPAHSPAPVHRPAPAKLRRRYGSTPLRLTRRGRITAVVTLALSLLLAVAALAGQASVASNEAGSPDVYEYVTVQPGQTLWELAAEVAPGEDPRETIERILTLNALRGGAVQAGQRIAVPR